MDPGFIDGRAVQARIQRGRGQVTFSGAGG